MDQAVPLSLGEEITARIDALAAISATPDAITRVFLTPQHRGAADMLMAWMREAGMAAHLDAIGNVCGRYEGASSGRSCLMLGSHYDTVRDGGRWDGPLGIITAIACVADLHRRHVRLPFAVEIVGFADEEGVRFGSTLLGSRAVAGTLDRRVFDSTDGDGVSMRDAMAAFGLDAALVGQAARARGDIHAYLELHIEQGPVLESEHLPVGVVTAISGATRLAVSLDGFAGHAGTVPMALRRDALAGAAECIVAIESLCKSDQALVGTVGIIDARPGATNVIPGRVSFTVDVRSASDADRKRAVTDIARRIEAIARRRDLVPHIDVTHESGAVFCALWLSSQIGDAIAAEGHRILTLPSGAGHDGMAMIDITAIAMIFVRCRGGISHNPAEHASVEDVDTAARVLLRVIENFRPVGP